MIHIVTSFSKEGYDLYGKRLLDSLKKYWPDAKVFPYCEDKVPIKTYAFGPDHGKFLKNCPEDGDDYRQQTRKFCHKVFALTGKRRPNEKWRIWIDGDVVFSSKVTKEWIEKILPEESVSYLGRKDWHHSECGFMVFDMERLETIEFLATLREAYVTGEIFHMEEKHDSWVFDRVRENFPKSMFTNLSKNITGKHVWPRTVLGEVCEHLKGPRKFKEKMDERYSALPGIINHLKPKSIVEIGVGNGERAMLMLRKALKHHKKIEYVGFDTFDTKNEIEEFDVRSRIPINELRARFKTFTKEHPGCQVKITKQLSTLPKKPDFALIDGGKSLKTVAKNFGLLKDAKTVLMDNFYEDEDNKPDVSRFGCNALVKEMGDFVVFGDGDPVPGGGRVRMAIRPVQAFPGPVNLDIKTRNCVPNDDIVANVRENLKLIDHWVRPCRSHPEVAVMVSSGPSMKSYIDFLRDVKGRIVTSKSAHDTLLEKGIVPWGCVLLDPRDHVADFIAEPHPEVHYFVASMCHVNTVSHLLDKGAQVWGYHAVVGAGEETVFGKLKDPYDVEAGSKILIGGGSTSAIRAISVLQVLGFRRFHLYGYDSSYPEKPEPEKATSGRMKDYYQVNVSGRPFWSDTELIAQAQDFNKLIEKGQFFDEIEVFGDGLIPHIWAVNRPIRPDFKELIP